MTVLQEDNDPTVSVEGGSIDIKDEAVLDSINGSLASVTAGCVLTPYIALEKVRKVLAYYKIFIPQTNFLEGDEGQEVFTVSQFGLKYGQTDDGEIKDKKSDDLHLYFEWSMNDLGLFDIYCEVVNNEDLEQLVAAYNEDSEDKGHKDSDGAETSFDTYRASNMNEEFEQMDEGLKMGDYGHEKEKKKKDLFARSRKMIATSKIDRWHKNKKKIDEAKKDKPPFEGGYKIKGPRKDRFGNIIKTKNIAKHLAKKAEKKFVKEDGEPKLGSHNVMRMKAKDMDPDIRKGWKDYKSQRNIAIASNNTKNVNMSVPGMPPAVKLQAQIQPYKHVDSEAKKDATRDKFVGQQNTRDIRRNPPITVKEDNINEISTGLARNYLKKNAASKKKAEAEFYKADWLDLKNKREGTGQPAKSAKNAKKAIKTLTKRAKGETMAKNKLLGTAKVLTKEERLDELSKGLLRRYAKKASWSAMAAKFDDDPAKERHRSKGLKQAGDRLGNVMMAKKKYLAKEDYDPVAKKAAEDAEKVGKKANYKNQKGAKKAWSDYAKHLKKKAVTGMDEDYDSIAKDNVATWKTMLKKHSTTKATDKIWKKAIKRDSKKAVTGMDEATINEVSRSLLQRYKKKADAQSEPLSKKYRKGTISDKDEKTLSKRGIGSSLAMQKLSGYGKPKVLAKEETLDESEKGAYRAGYDAWSHHLTKDQKHRPTNPYKPGKGMGEWERGAADAYDKHSNERMTDKKHLDEVSYQKARNAYDKAKKQGKHEKAAKFKKYSEKKDELQARYDDLEYKGD